ncbi:MAG TPA: hypothetical protein DCS63_10325 [Elusimicrobia bacterium]|nr:hypothetical protein [Elusimicrobiota bacterium]
MNRTELQKIVAAARLPEPVKKYISVLSARGSGPGFRRLLKADPAPLLENMASVMDQAGAILGVPAREVLFSTGFNTGNLAPGRLEAALAELKAVTFLAAEGFSAIGLVPQARGRTADITAARGGNTYAFEVRCVTGGGGADKNGERTLALLEKKYRKKMPQASCSRKKGRLSHCGLVLVLNAGNFPPPSAGGALEQLAAALYEKVGRPPRAHVCLLSGGESGVSPAWGA